MKFILTGLYMIGICSIATPLFAETPDTVPAFPKPSKSDAEPINIIDSEATRQQQYSQKKYPLKVIRIIGANVFKEKELLKLFGDYSGREVSYEDMVKAGSKLSAYFEDRGHNILVSMPQQDISDGIVLYYLAANAKHNITQSESDKKSLWQQFVTRSTHSGPLTRALSGKLSYGAYYLIKPSLTISEEFNDNIGETKEQRKADLITSMSPAISIIYSAKRWDVSLAYNLTYQSFLHNTMGDKFSNNAAIASNMRLIDNFLFLDVSNTFSRTSIDANRENPYVNLTNTNNFTISPHIEYLLTPSLMAIGSYSYSKTTTPGSNLMNKQSHSFKIRLNKEMPTNTSVFMEINASRTESGNDTDYSRILHFMGINQRFSDGSLSVRGGYSLLDFETVGPIISPYWDIVFARNWKDYTFNLNSGILYDSTFGINASETRFVKALITKGYHNGLIEVSAKYSQDNNSQLGTTFRQWMSIGIRGDYALTGKVTGTAAISTNKYHSENEYQNTLFLGMNYQLFYDLLLSAGYRHLTYSGAVFAPTGSGEANRITVTIYKNF